MCAPTAIDHATGPELGQALGQLVIGDGQDLHGQDGGVGRPIDRDGRDRDSPRHLHRGIQRVDPADGPARKRHADDRESGLGRHGSGQVGRHARPQMITP